MRRRSRVLACGALLAMGTLGAAAGCDSFASSATDASDARAESAETPDAGAGAGDADAGAAAEAGTLTALYARSFGSVDDAGEAGAIVAPSGMVVDPGGGVSVLGTYGFGAVDLGGGVKLPVASAADAFLLRLDGSGGHINSKAFTADGDQFGGPLAGSGSKLYASFEVAGTVVFGAGTDFLNSMGNAGKYNAGTVRLDTNAVSSGLATFRGSLNVLAKASALGAGESVLSFGDWDSAISVNGATSQPRIADKLGLFVVRSFILGGSDIVSTNLCDDGTLCIASAIGSSPTTGASVAGGRFSGHIGGADGGAGVTTAPNDSDAYLMKLDENLVLEWVMSLKGTGSAEVLAVTAVPGTTDFVAAGVFGGSLQLPGQPEVAATDPAQIFVVRLDTAGKVVWVRAYGSAGEDRVRAITADAAGNVFLTGWFRGPTLDLGTSKLTNADTGGLGTADVFVAWLDPFGALVYAARFGDGEANEDAAAIGLDALGNVAIVGTFTRTIDFGTGALSARGRADMFVAKLHR